MVDIPAIENGDRGGPFPEKRLLDPTDIMTICSNLITLNIIKESQGGSSNGNVEDGRQV